MLVVQARFRYTQNPCVGLLLVAGWCFQHFVRNPAQVNTRSKSLTINVMCWPQTWQRATLLHPTPTHTYLYLNWNVKNISSWASRHFFHGEPFALAIGAF